MSSFGHRVQPVPVKRRSDISLLIEFGLTGVALGVILTAWFLIG